MYIKYYLLRIKIVFVLKVTFISLTNQNLQLGMRNDNGFLDRIY